MALHVAADGGTVERLDLALLVEAEHDGVRPLVDTQPGHIPELGDEVRIGGRLKPPHPVQTVDAPNARCGAHRDAGLVGHHGGGPVGVSKGRSVKVNATTRSATARASGGIRGGRVLSRNSPATALRDEPLLSAPDRRLGLDRPPRDLVDTDPVRT